MVIYICSKCNKVFNKKSNYNYHVNIRKRSCLNNPTNPTSPNSPKLVHTTSPFKDLSHDKFQCLKCNKSYATKSNLNKHINNSCKSKTTCQKWTNLVLDDDNNNKLYITDNENINDSDNLQDQEAKQGKVNLFDSILQNPELKTESIAIHSMNNINNNNKCKKVKTPHKCNYCQKYYSTNSNLCKHLKICKVKKTMNEEREQIFQRLFEENKKQQDQITEIMKENSENKKELAIFKTHMGSTINTNSHNSTTQNIINNSNTQNNNVQLVAFGKEDLSYIGDSTCKRILNKGFTSVPVMVKYVHFNKNNPKYHNVYISNMRDGYVITYDGEKWKLKDRNETLEQLCDDKQEFLERKYYDFHDSLPEKTRRKFGRFLRHSCDDKTREEMKGSIKRTLYNGRDMAIKKRKMIGN